MRPRDLGLLIALSAGWGASFLLIKIGLREIGPFAVVTARITFGALGLGLAVAALPAMRRPGGQRAPVRSYVIGAILGMSFSNVLVSWGAGRIPSGTAAILVATQSLSAALIGQWWPVRGLERLSRGQWLGLAVGFGGTVVVILGGEGDPGKGGGETLLGEVAVLGGASLAVLGGLYTRHAFAGVADARPALGQLVVSTLILLPLAAAFDRPDGVPGWETWAAMLALGVGGTGAAYALYYELIRSAGAAMAMTVNYLALAFAVAYGLVFLAESIAPVTVLGLALIVGGLAVTSRGLPRRRREAVSTPQPAETPAR